MIEREVEVLNRAGIHARPAALIVKVANQFASNLYMEKDKMKINGKSIMGIITLGAAYKSRLMISTEGPDEQEAADAIEQLFLNRFEE
ncbi:MAG: HPr family phosphocarrier protein [Sphaerochaetaceae bacterium]|jgi:phosphocarrier protein|nr:HPr family phosphocarrier protein [Sphaerochaetaceae bacterium]MDD3941585.1 HPr family phosphocarrier protein [Sphaerochaetaceae bacterium]MDX9939083.1 HPr family phosphocarrier protein [Sphaerochaetaceae bacterium]